MATYMQQASPTDGDDADAYDEMLNTVYTTVPKQNKDGQPPKRRGPKPDSKPPKNLRQERNRIAQRTHRARKEAQVRQLEAEVMQLRQLWRVTVQEKNDAQIEVKRLTDLLLLHGLSMDSITSGSSYQATLQSQQMSTTPSSQRLDSSATATSPSAYSVNPQSPTQMRTGYGGPSLSNNAIDYNQRGVEFVLALESPCNEHKQYLLVRSHNPNRQPMHHPMERADDMEFDHMSGHALMISCPPLDHVMNKAGEPYPHQMPDVPLPDLVKLLEVSGRVHHPGDELTPVQAWFTLMGNPRFASLSAVELDLVQAYLLETVRCYGFGAVLEEYEILAAIDRAIASRDTDLPIRGAIHDCEHHNQPLPLMV